LKGKKYYFFCFKNNNNKIFLKCLDERANRGKEDSFRWRGGASGGRGGARSGLLSSPHLPAFLYTIYIRNGKIEETETERKRKTERERETNKRL